ncbi:MAG: hypothetical protein AMK72_15560 [Planctomycetes bacterium SM23_25]|nr:MAG: hypothetical protein AMK72_15560 [Planctomycetes bacterium SM23_25]
MLRACIPALALLHVVPVAFAAEAEADGLIASPEPGWPQWRGKRRDGISDETGLLPSWPEGGPRLLWTATGLGRGWSSPIITKGTIYITGDVGDDLCIFAFDTDGKKKWETTNGPSWKRPHPGARASCAYADGRLYHMNAHGRIACLDAAGGKELWATNMLERFGGRNITWAISECVLVDGPKVYVTPGGEKAYMAALDSGTGKTVWAGEPLDDPRTQRTGYASPILLRFGGRRLLVNLALRAMVCVDADKGRIQWTVPRKTRYDAACATPVYHRGGVFYTLPTRSGCVFLALVAEGGGIRFRKMWEGLMDSCHGGAVAVDGYIYGSGWDATGWVCYDAATGTQHYNDKTIAVGAAVYADGRLYCLGERGTVALVRPTPEAFDIASRFRLVEGDYRDAWAHPVILDRRLYLRYHDRLYCYDIARPGGADP